MNETELRELDKWICIHVFGWQERPAYRGSERLEGQSFWVCDGKAVSAVGANHTCCWTPFTTNDADALKVLEKCSERVCVRIRKQFSGLYCVWAEGDETDSSPQPTLPLAICLFSKLLYSEKG